ncbi:MAG: biotin transporter BioY [Rhodospirillaceae bacterium]
MTATVVRGPMPASLVDTLCPVHGRRAALARNIALAVAGSLALWLSAKIQVPFWPVPVTMQTMVVTLIGASFGWRLGLATVALYLAEGAVGLPVFAGTPERGIGLAYMAGPTGGYLIGFAVAAAAMAPLAGRGRNGLRMAVAMTVGTAIILLCGFLHLAAFVGLEAAWLNGVVPFLAGSLLKIALGTALMVGAWRLGRAVVKPGA